MCRGCGVKALSYVKTLVGPDVCTTCAGSCLWVQGKFNVVTRGFKGICDKQIQSSNERDEKSQDKM